MSETYTLSEIADRVGGRVEGDGDRRVTGLAPIHSAGPEDLTFLENQKFLKSLGDCRAAGVIVDLQVALPEGTSAVRVPQPVVAWAILLELFHPYEREFDGVSPAAHVSPSAKIGAGVGIGPGAWIGPDVEIGEGTEIYPGVSIGRGARIGGQCRLYSGVHVYHGCVLGDRVILHAGAVIGADGYGYVQERRDDPAEPVVHRKVPQVGIVIIQDDVEIGANTTIDRAALEATVIGKGTKIDNQVMIGHNCKTGAHCLLIAQVGISGSTELGHYVTIAGQSGLAGHLKVGDQAVIGARTGILKDVAAGQVMLGSPALPGLLARRAYSQIEHLPEFRKTLAELVKRVERLEGS